MADTPLGPLGVRGLRQWGGIIAETVIPAMRNPQIRALTRKRMTTEPMIAASLLGTELIMRQVPMRITPAIEKDTAAIEAADWLHGALFEDMTQTWSETLSEILTMREHGWSLHNIVYKQRNGVKPDEDMSSKFTDGKYGWQGFEIRGQDTLLRWNFDPVRRDKLISMTQQPETGEIIPPIPAESFLLFRLGQHKGNPEGISLLDNVYKPWYDKQQIRSFQNIGIERDLAGYPVMYVPREVRESTTPEAMALRISYEDFIRNIRRNESEGALIPAVFDEHGNRLYELILLSAQGGGRRQFDIPAIIQQLNVEMLMALFTDLLMLGHEVRGNQAVSGDKTSMLGFALSAILDNICAVINRYAIPRLWRLNGFAPELQPLLSHDDAEDIDLDQLGRFIGQVATAGLDVIGHEAEVWERAGFATVEEEATL